MKNKSKSKIHFYIDPELHESGNSMLIEDILNREKIKFIHNIEELDESYLNVIFTNAKRIKKFNSITNKVFICSNQEVLDSSKFLPCDFLEASNIEQIIIQIFEAYKQNSINIKLKNSDKFFENIRLENENKTDNEINQCSKDFENILELELDLLNLEKISDWNSSFKTYIKKSSWISLLQIGKAAEIFEDESFIEVNSLILKLPYEDYFIFLKSKTSLKESSLKIELIINMLIKCLQVLDQNLIRTDDEIDFWKRVFAKIPYPMAVISSLGDLLIYNELFAKIGILPKECLGFKDQESIEIHQQFYIVKKIEFELDLQRIAYFVFYTSNNSGISLTDKKSGVDDLGIVSSSIAHELNNPLAGILAALSLLALEDDWDSDSLDEIEDMKNGARRCKELIEIFLGFSRFSPNQKNQVSVKDSLDQAINLLRFRMVESNLRIEMRYFKTLEVLSIGINSSILSMILYLIINELLTAFAHHRLITQSFSTSLSGEVLEFSNQIIIRLDAEFEYEDKLAQSKLIQHLTAFEKMEINFLKSEIRLISRI